MLTPNAILAYYKRKDIQQAMIDNAKNREIAVRYSEGFGKRPDILTYLEEIMDLAKNGATSFHASEELWHNPRMISSEMKKSEAEKLKLGWDLIIDIDSPFWEISKITAWLIIQSLKDFGINSVSVKFSGNKGFHIGVPFEAFPTNYNGAETKNLFPDAPRKIASLLLEYIADKYIEVNGNNDIVFGEGLSRKFKIPYQKLHELTGKGIDELTLKICSNCIRKISNERTESVGVEFVCRKCGNSITASDDRQFEKCPKCGILMEKMETKKKVCACGSESYLRKFNSFSVIEVDTILISPRHLFRMPYSLHEKSGLASVVFNPDKILEFEKKFATPEIVKTSKHIFVDRKKAKKDEAGKLLSLAMEYGEEKDRRERAFEKKNQSEKSSGAFEALQEAIPEVLFPPCIEKMLAGMEDGKKRSLFILINFLKSAGWSYELIENRIKEWNKKNPEPLKETIIIGQLRYHKRESDKILPPNCDNKMYYQGMRVCMPDNFCKKVKNPVNYAILKAKIERKGQSKAKSAETPVQ